MKHIYIVVLSILSLFSAQKIQAQEIYNYVLDNATRTVNNPTSSFTQTRIAQFKRTALIYLRSQALEKRGKISTEFLDTQAYYLSEFLTAFLSDVVKCGKEDAKSARRRILEIYMKASETNPLFGDTDEETTLSYVKSGEDLTPFSLDTDWQKAKESAEILMKSK